MATAPTPSAGLALEPAHRDRHRPSTLAHLVERLHPRRFDEIVDELKGLSMTLDNEGVLEVTRPLFEGRFAFKQRVQMLGCEPA